VSLILALVPEECPGLKRINLEGCRPTAVMCAVALRAKEVFGAAPPRELYASITGACDGKRCALSLLLEQLLKGPGANLEIDPEFGPQAADEDVEGESSILLMVARLGSAWVMALVLSVGKVRFECHEQDRHMKTPMHYATARGDTDLCHVLLAAGTDVNKADARGSTPLLMACQAGNLELAAMLKDAGGDVNKADAQGSTPRLSAYAAGDLALAQSLVSWGAEVRAVGQDGAGLMALAWHSQRTHMIKFAMQHDPRHDGHIVSHGGSCGSACAKAYLSPHNISRWLLAGSAPRTLVLEIGALMK
jgi:hypothetical protein